MCNALSFVNDRVTWQGSLAGDAHVLAMTQFFHRLRLRWVQVLVRRQRPYPKCDRGLCGL